MPRSVPPSSFLRQPLDAVLTGVASVRVFRVLARHGGALTVSRIARDTGLSDQGVRNVLLQAEEAGIVTAVGSGRSWVYRLSRTPLAAAVARLFDAEASRIERIVEGLKAVLADVRIAAAWIFGSVARGEDGPRSDVDLAVVWDAPDEEAEDLGDALRERLRPLSSKHGVRFSVIALSRNRVLRLDEEDAPLLRDIARDAWTVTGPEPATLLRRLRAGRPAA